MQKSTKKHSIHFVVAKLQPALHLTYNYKPSTIVPNLILFGKKELMGRGIFLLDMPAAIFQSLYSCKPQIIF